MSGSILILMYATFLGVIFLLGYCLEVKSYTGFLFGSLLIIIGVIPIFSGSFSQHHGAAPPLEGSAARLAGAIILLVGIQFIRISFRPHPKNGKVQP